MAADKYQFHDYYQVDDLLTTEHKLIRESVRAFVKEKVSPIIEDHAQRAEFPRHLVKDLAAIGAFGPTIPVEYGGGGLDEISYGIIMQELERGDSGIRSTASVQGSLVIYLRQRRAAKEIFAQTCKRRVVWLFWVNGT
jgi:glutaryl-CoA dehydrogenase